MSETPHDPKAEVGAAEMSADMVQQPAELLTAQLSAFVDDELPDAESSLFVRQLLRDRTLQRSLGRYVLIGEALRQPMSARKPGVSRDFSARVAAALEQDSHAEVAVAINQRHAAPVRWQSVWKNAAGLGIAASVMAVVWFGVRNGANHDVQTSQMAATHAENGVGYVVPVSASGPAAPIPATQLTNYVIAHSEYSTTLGRQNLMTGLLSEEAQPIGQSASQSASVAAWPGQASSSVSH